MICRWGWGWGGVGVGGGGGWGGGGRGGIERNTFFGPYLGVRHSNFKSAQESGYAWSIADKNGKVLVLFEIIIEVLRLCSLR